MRYSLSVTADSWFMDRFGRMTPASILYLAQTAADEHCQQQGLGYKALAERGLVWVVSRHTVTVNRLPLYGEQLTVHTWPMPTTRVAYPRATEVCDAEGNVLVSAVSLWVLMDIHKRTMVLPDKSGVTVPGMCTGREVEIPRSLIPRPRSQHVTHQVTYSLLDRNGHMNNTRYLAWATDLLSSEFHREHPIKQFTVCYLSEALEGQQIRLNWDYDPQAARLSLDANRAGLTAADERVFSVQICFE